MLAEWTSEILSLSQITCTWVNGMLPLLARCLVVEFMTQMLSHLLNGCQEECELFSFFHPVFPSLADAGCHATLQLTCSVLIAQFAAPILKSLSSKWSNI